MSSNSFHRKVAGSAAEDDDEDEGTAISSEASLLPCSPRRRRKRRFLIPSATSRSLSFGKDDEEPSDSQILVSESKMNSTNSTSSITPRKQAPITSIIDIGDDAVPSRKGSLFGTVMQLARHSENDDQEQQQQPKQQQTENSDGTATFDPLQSTPSRFRQIADTNHHLLLTPGGFSLMNLLKSANSPFAKVTTPSANNKSSPTDGGEEQDHEATKNMGDWDEATCCGRDYVNVLDWSLKSRLRLEGCPADVLLSLPRVVDARGMQQFMMFLQQQQNQSTTMADEASTTCISTQRMMTQDECILHWQSALLYWQYPSCHQSDASTTARNDVAPQQSKKRLRLSSGKNTKLGRENTKPTLDGASRLETESKLSLVRPGADAYKKDENDSHSKMIAMLSTTRLSTEQREWQEAFWSLSRQWQQTIAGQLAAPQGKDSPLTTHDLVTSYFYAIGSQQTALFRLGQMADGQWGPLIVMSTTTVAIREKLRSMNIKLRCLDSLEGQPGQEYQERGDQMDEQLPKSKQTDGGGDSPLVKRELELLRKAQASGETVGANVSFKWNKSSGHDPLKHRRRNHPPLYVSGMDDCAAFCEVYLNTVGFSKSSIHEFEPLCQSPPLLCCRHLGPFLHCNLQTLRVSSKRIRNTSAASQGKQTSVPNQVGATAISSNNLIDVLEVSGTILPCAYNEILYSAIHQVMHEDLTEDDTTLALANSAGEDSSHHLVMYAKPLEDDHESVPTARLMHSPTALLNGVGISNRKGTDSNSSFGAGLAVVKECDHGRAMSVAVWDASRRDAIVFKTDLVLQL